MTIRSAKLLLAASLVLLLPFFASAQQTTTVPRLPPAGSLNSTDIFPLDQQNNASATGWTTRRGSFSQLQSFFLGNIVGITSAWTAAQAFDGGATVPTLPFGDNSLNAASTAFVQSAISGSVGGLPSVASPAALAAATVPNAQTRITVLAMASSGTSTCSLDFTPGTSAPTGIYGEVLNVASGIYWEPKYSNSPVKACEFKTVADGSYSFSTGGASGTDNAPMIQAALDYAMQNGLARVCISNGAYATNDTIHMGWGNAFYHLELASCGDSIGAFSTGLGGVAIYPIRTDRCAINVQGGRFDRIEGISLIGANYPWINNNLEANWLSKTTLPTTAASGSGTTATLTVTPDITGNTFLPIPVGMKITVSGVTPSGFNGTYVVTASTSNTISYANATVGPQTVAGTVLPVGIPSAAAAFLNPSIIPTGSNPGGIQQHSPYGGVCIDAFKGAQPTDHYPTKTYPAWVLALSPGIAQYNLAPSSDTTYRRGMIQGFGVAIMSSPNGDGNGDFTRVLDSAFNQNVYVIAVGNTQSRNVELRTLNIAGYHTFLDNRTFGAQSGELGGPIENISGGEGYQLYNIQTGTSANFAPSFVYAEAQGIIGHFAASSGATVNLTSHNLNFGCSSTGEIPPAMIEANSGSAFDVHDMMLGCISRISPMFHVAGLGPVKLRWNGSGQLAGGSSVTTGNFADSAGGFQSAFNYTGGVFLPQINPNFPNVQIGSLEWSGSIFGGQMNTPTGAPSFGGTFAPANIISGSTPLTHSMSKLYDGVASRIWTMTPPVPFTTNIFNSVNTVFSSCDQISFNWPSGNQGSGGQTGNGGTDIQLGHVVYFPVSGTLFVVNSVGALSGGNYPATAVQTNNLVVDKTTGACVASNIANVDVQVNSVYVLPTNISIPQNVFYGSCTASNVTVASATDGAGDAPGSTKTMKIGARMWYPAVSAAIHSALGEFFGSGTVVTGGNNAILTMSTLVGGSGYNGGGTATFLNVPLTGGTGAGATANITVTAGVVTAVANSATPTTMAQPLGGQNYTVGDILSASAANLGNSGGSGFTITVATVSGTPTYTVNPAPIASGTCPIFPLPIR